jgi:hypothetical protein
VHDCAPCTPHCCLNGVGQCPAHNRQPCK